MTVNIIISGIHGKMGQVAQAALADAADLTLVAGVGRDANLAQAIAHTQADVVIDLTTPQAVFANAQTIITAGARPIIGTSGLTPDQITALTTACKAKNRGGIIAPNFSLGAILMMKYAQDAARYFDAVEIVEIHHPHKLDAPSGTAVKTAQMISAAQAATEPQPAAARGESEHGVPIHSIRLPGYFSAQSVIFAAGAERLTLRHDGLDRRCTVAGILLACRRVMQLNYLVYGLEQVI